MKEEYVRIQIEKLLRDNKKDPIDLIVRCLMSEEERYRLAAEISENISGLSLVLDISDRTAYRSLEKYGIEVKKEDEKD